MVRLCLTTACLAALLAGASPAWAQTSVSSLPPERAAEVDRWVKEFTEWKEWWVEWRGRREPGLFTSSRTRREKPAPPTWLARGCEAPVDANDPLAPVCALVREWGEDDAVMELRQERMAAATQHEKPTKITWWEHMHVDLVAPAMQAQSGIVGIGGMHASFNVKGRFQMFAAPGLMFVSTPSQHGGREWKVATNYGLGFRLFDFSFPGGRAATAHLNLAKAWMLSDSVDLLTDRTMDFFTLSISFKDNR
jgi:hypothetical protein